MYHFQSFTHLLLCLLYMSPTKSPSIFCHLLHHFLPIFVISYPKIDLYEQKNVFGNMRHLKTWASFSRRWCSGVKLHDILFGGKSCVIFLGGPMWVWRGERCFKKLGSQHLKLHKYFSFSLAYDIWEEICSVYFCWEACFVFSLDRWRWSMFGR